ncbi:MAG: MFS transporter [Chloroflexi bacterium]|nr:MFS transporter [Chloroflexota bacterium]
MLAAENRYLAQIQDQRESEAKRSRWFYAYGLFNVATLNVDSLIVIFATVVIGAAPATISQIDVMDTVGAVVGGIIFGRLADRIPWQRPLLAALFALGGLSAMLFALTTSAWMLMALSFVFGLFMGAPTPSSSILISRLFPKRMWPEKFGAFNRVFSLGGGLGLAFGILWLGVSGQFLDQEWGLRLLFVASGLVAVLGALCAYLWVVEQSSPVQRHDTGIAFDERVSVDAEPQLPTLGQVMELLGRAAYFMLKVLLGLPGFIAKILMSMPIHALETQRYFRGIPLPMGSVHTQSTALLPSLFETYRGYQVRSRHDESRHQLPDSLKLYYATVLVILLGYAMTTTVLPVFIARHLGAPGYMALAATAALYGFSTLSYGVLAKQVDHIHPLRMQAIAVTGRGLLFLALGLLAFITLPLYASLVILLCLIALSGIAWAAINVAGVTRVARLAPVGRQGEAVGFYQSAYYGGTIVGALLGGTVAQFAGLPEVFAVAGGLSLLATLMLLKL